MAKQKTVLSVVPTMDEREHTLEFTVTIRKWGKGEQVTAEALRSLTRAVKLAFGDLAEVSGEPQH